MAMRAVWKGNLCAQGIDIPVALHTAVSPSSKLHFHILNRKTEHRVNRAYIDAETGKTVASADLMRGFDTGGGDLLVLSPEDIAAAAPEADKQIAIQDFIPCDEIDRLYFDRPYYLTPATGAAAPLYAEFRDTLKKRRAAAVAHAVLFRRLRAVLVRAHGDGLIATLLNFDHEVRSPEAAFADIPTVKIKGEMLDLAQEIIKRLSGAFDPAKFSDRYEDALAELIKAKAEGRKIPAPKKRKAGKKLDLMEALRKSAAA
jgi:DNA end-binding protein Ku